MRENSGISGSNDGSEGEYFALFRIEPGSSGDIQVP